jgi:hypothetical protein
MTHANLFPSLYSMDDRSPADISTLPISSCPSSLDLTRGLSSGTDETKSAYRSLLLASSDYLLHQLISSRHLDATSPQIKTTRLKNSVIFLSASGTALGSPEPRIKSNAVQLSLRISLQANGLLVQSLIKELPLKRFPSEGGGLLVDSSVLLAPFGQKAEFVRLLFTSMRERGSKREIREEIKLRNRWSTMLENLGLILPETETWVVCRLRNVKGDGKDDEVVWPSTLCLIDGSRPQPQPSPELSTSPSQLAETFATSLSGVTSTPLASLPLDSEVRQRFASILGRPRGSIASSSNTSSIPICQQSISDRMTGVERMKEEMTAVREEKEALDREFRAAEVVRATVIAEAARKKLETQMHAGQEPIVSGHSAAPINMRTPISHNSSIGAASPADHVFDHPSRATLDHNSTNGVAELYPSPSELGIILEGKVKSITVPAVVHTAKVIPPDPTFGSFDWGDEFQDVAQPTEFDDGMMMGLTDDDFSFFDEPATPLPPNFTPYSTNQPSAGPSPAYVNHLSYLLPATPFASAASPASAQSPHFTGSSPSFVPDPFLQLSTNSLGLSPGTPFTPQIDLAESHAESMSTPVGLVIIDQVGRISRASGFEAVNFGVNHSVSDDKYLSMQGKFGLPSPAEEARDAGQIGSVAKPVDGSIKSDIRKDSSSSRNWMSSMFDPRVSAATELKRKRKLSSEKDSFLGKRVSLAAISTILGERRWLCGLKGDEIHSKTTDGFGSAEHTDDEPMESTDHSRRTSLEDPTLTSPVNAFGAALLLLRTSFTLPFQKITGDSDGLQVTLKSEVMSESSRELAAILLADQITQNKDYRIWVQEATDRYSSMRNDPITCTSHLSISYSSKYSLFHSCSVSIFFATLAQDHHQLYLV